MDERDQPTRWDHDVPTPPPTQAPAPQQTEFQAPGGPRRRRGRRVLAVGTAAAVLVAAGAGGYAVGRHQFDSQPAAAEAGGSTQQYGGGPAQGQQGQQLPPGFGPGDLGGGSGTGPDTQGTPYGSAATTRKQASSDQLTGLVRIATTLRYQGARAAGTGMILTSTGEVVTNHHVVAGATKITVKVMSTGQRYAATVVGTDSKDDVAVLQLTGATGLDTVTTDTDGVTKGDAVTAVGDAGGSRTTFSQAPGTVTALGRSITTRSEGTAQGERLRHMIEISSDVISGDSGGATYDDQGEVVGMTTAASSGSSDIVGFAIPITRVLRVADDLESGVTASRYTYGPPAFLGVGLGSGTTVAGVYRNTPAARAGISVGATITAVDGLRVGDRAALKQAVADHQPGDLVSVTWRDRDGTTHSASVRLIAGPVA